MVIATMIPPPHEWKAMISSKPASHESNHYRLMRTSNLPNLACMDFCRKVQESFPGDKIRRQTVEIRDWKYKFKTGDLIRIPLSNIMSRPAENETARRSRDKKLNYCKWTYAESGTVPNEEEIHALTKSAAMNRHVTNSRSQKGSRQHRSIVLTMPLTKSSIMTISSQHNQDPYCSIIRETMRNFRKYNIENNFRTIKQCSEIPKTKFQETKKMPLKVPFSSQAINIKLEKSFKYKVNANELPRSQTPLNEKDPDKMSFKNVDSFLSDHPESGISMDKENRSDLNTGAIEAANADPGSNTPSEKSLDHSCRPENGSSLRLPENTEAMNLVSADVFTSPSRSVHSCGAFKTSFRLRRAPRHGTKTKKENHSPEAPPQNESKQRIKLQRFLDFAVSTRERTTQKDSFISVSPSKDFLRVPTQHNGFGKQLLVAGSEASFENSQELNSRCHTEIRESNTAKTFPENDCKSRADIGKSRQYTFSYSDRKSNCKRNPVQKSHSELADILVKDQPHEKGGKTQENGGSIKSAHSVVIIPGCTPVANDGGNSSDSEIVADQPTMAVRCRRPTGSANFSCETATSLNLGSNSNSSSASSTNASRLSVFSRPKLETSHQNRNQKSKTAADETEQPLKDYAPVKLTFRKERIISNKNSEFLSKFLNSEKNQITKTSDSEL